MITYQPVINSNPILTNYRAIPHITASSSQVFNGLVHLSSGSPFMTYDIFSSLGNSPVQNNEVLPLMLLTENLLSQYWNTPEEDEAWADL